jgi:hypothetical protein
LASSRRSIWPTSSEVAVEARDGLTTALVSLDGTLTARDAKSETSFDKV